MDKPIDLFKARREREAKERPKKVERPKQPPVTGSWRDRIISRHTSAGPKPERTVENAMVILAHDPEWGGVLAFDDFRGRVVALKKPPSATVAASCYPAKWTDTDDTLLAAWLMRVHGLDLRFETVFRAVVAVAESRRFNPLTDYLSTLRWDGQPRIDTWLSTFAGVASSEYSRAVGARWLIGCVARAFEPGIKFDTVLVLEGAQGAKKSTLLLELAGAEYFCDELPDLGSKDAALQLCGSWIIELAELHALGRSDLDRAKAFVTRRTDKYRPPYSRHTVEVPRSSAFAATTNRSDYLKDETGARRWWPVKVGEVDLASLRRDRDQLWAETLHRYRAGEKWYLDTLQLVEAATEEQAERQEIDPWEDPIASFVTLRNEVKIPEVLEMLGLKVADQDPKAEKRVGSALRKLKFHRERKRVGKERVYVFLRNTAEVCPPSSAVPPASTETGDTQSALFSGLVPPVPPVPPENTKRPIEHSVWVLETTVDGGPTGDRGDTRENDHTSNTSGGDVPITARNMGSTDAHPSWMGVRGLPHDGANLEADPTPFLDVSGNETGLTAAELLPTLRRQAPRLALDAMGNLVGFGELSRWPAHLMQLLETRKDEIKDALRAERGAR